MAPDYQSSDAAQASASHSLPYRPEVDGMRAIAVLAVVLHHVAPTLVTGGYVGVDVFFVISGFLIARIISREILGGKFCFAQFYARRAARLLPALYCVLIATVGLGWFFLLPSEFLSTAKTAVGTILFVSNGVLWRELQRGYFAGDAGENPLLHTWSLGVEEQFYFIFPLLLFVLIRWGRVQTRSVFVMGAVMSLAMAEILLPKKGVAVFFLSPFRAWELLAGALLALAGPYSLGDRTRSAIAFLGLMLIAMSVFLFDPHTRFPGLNALVPVSGAAMMLAATGTNEGALTRALSYPPVVYMGVISYSLYLWHWPIVVFGKLFLGPEVSGVEGLAMISLSIAVASASYHWIERPLRVRANKIAPRIVVSVGLGFGVLFALAIAPGIMTDGAPGRFLPEVSRLDAMGDLPIPFLDCEGTFCHIGEGDRTEFLFWGDSHMLAWSSGIDSMLKSSGRGGILVYQSACPPITPAALKVGSSCAAGSELVNTQLRMRPEITTVVLAARWTYYLAYPNAHFRERSLNPFQVAEKVLSTAQELRNRGVRVIVVGPVPEYSRSVPIQLAQKLAFGWSLDSIDRSDQTQGDVLEKLFEQQAGNGIQYVDPAKTICTSQCLISDGARVFYRDSNHLSVEGALQFSSGTFSFLMSPN
ncbi:MAG: acyltransferase [Planctomycetales bacterium]|nr:acyltransferase [Planctomycetales bacterium]